MGFSLCHITYTNLCFVISRTISKSNWILDSRKFQLKCCLTEVRCLRRLLRAHESS
jgi:hypothetical protein